MAGLVTACSWICGCGCGGGAQLRRRRAAAAAALASRAAAPPPSPACGAACLRAAARPSSSSRAPLEVAAARCLLTAGFPCSLHRRAASPCPLHPPLARLGGRGEARQSGRGGRASLPCFSSPVAAERGGAAAERGERAEHGRGARRPTRGRWQARGQGAATGRGRRAGPARRGAVGAGAGERGERERERGGGWSTRGGQQPRGSDVAVHVGGQHWSYVFWTSSDTLE